MFSPIDSAFSISVIAASCVLVIAQVFFSSSVFVLFSVWNFFMNSFFSCCVPCASCFVYAVMFLFASTIIVAADCCTCFWLYASFCSFFLLLVFCIMMNSHGCRLNDEGASFVVSNISFSCFFVIGFFL